MSTDDATFVYSSTDIETDPLIMDLTRLEAVRSRLVESIRRAVDDASAEGVVVAMSGGLDSTVTAVLAVEALGRERVLGLGLPCHKTDREHAIEARTIADGLGIEYHEIQLRPLLEAFERTVSSELEPAGDDADRPNERTHELGNAVARFRMTCAYYAANRRSRLVLGTANRSELLLGYFTKYGDGAADAFPIGDLYKTEVRALAERLGVPRRIVTKEPSAGFFAGQTDLEELGAPYSVIDPLLCRLVDDGQPIADAAKALEIDRQTARSIAWMAAETAHKRTVPPTPGLDGRDDQGRQFRRRS
ncbi:NAD+ synthase [Natrarchaeobaculum sulfurireducens]|uniref:NH(3)-dependent NAD(+) synthetase n=1 Tax=Natrarchaeobaculum sulfurireducens TaxID=2044521 RepID=A0A346PL14_9EURY|nr:NAD+ synthase [Natrarchaeobaculum sulfurireducens]AXR80209.1 NAD synthetase [Natrarchaeobaculum sulfurireducens]